MNGTKVIIQEYNGNKNSFWVDAEILKDVPGLYKWWAKEDLVKELLRDLGYGNPKFGKNVKFEDLKRDGHFAYDASGTYCCVYVGISDNVLRRIIANHVFGSMNNSTLRRHIGYIIQNRNPKKPLNNKELKPLIDSVILQMRISISYVVGDKTDLENEEKKQINEKLHILNTKDNDYGILHQCGQAEMIKERLDELKEKFLQSH